MIPRVLILSESDDVVRRGISASRGRRRQVLSKVRGGRLEMEDGEGEESDKERKSEGDANGGHDCCVTEL